MNILVIGNGFDLAHGLPTTYKDFLDYVHVFKYYYETENKGLFEFADKYQRFKLYILNLFENSHEDKKKRKILRELAELIKDNKWFDYFWSINEDGGWIDFEKEISKVVQALDSARKDRNTQMKNNPEISRIEFKKYDEKILQKVLGEYGLTDLRNIETIKESLIKDLDKLIRCLEIYLWDYVGQAQVKVRLPDVEEKNISHVLSFNYTHTYEKIYDLHTKEITYDYIHGKVNAQGNMEDCNLILGIDEYLEDEEEQRKDNEFIQFKKFYQRIYKKTGCGYTGWIKHAEKFFRVHNDVYILGHSLDITDGDILSNLIMMENTKTTIFYHNKKALENQICNLVKILGEKTVIEKTSGNNATIIFEKQSDAIAVL